MWIWLGIFIYGLLIAALIWILVIMVKLCINKEYRECPPLVPSFGNEKKILLEQVGIQLEQATIPLKVLDPGCGTGTLVVELAKRFPKHQFIGIEWSPVIAKIAAFNARKLPNVKIISQDMFSYSFKDFDVVACFLMQPLMQRFGHKLTQDCKPGTMIYSNSFYIPQFKPQKIVETKGLCRFKNVFIYKI